MQKRLISQNIIQCQNQSLPQFTAYASFIAYQTQSSIKIKTLNKDIRELQLKITKDINKYFFYLSQHKFVFVIEFKDNNIELYQIQIKDNQIKAKIFHKFQRAKKVVPLKNGIAYIMEEKYVKIFNFFNLTTITVCQCVANSTLLQHQGQSIFILSPIQNSDTKILRIYNKNIAIYQQSSLNIDYINQPLAIYKDKYIFQQNKQTRQIQIYNITISKIIGKFNFQGIISHAIIKGNILLLITSKQNMDRYCFYTLNSNIEDNKSILSFRSLYEKGKGSFYQTFTCNEELGQYIVQGKVYQFMKYLEKINVGSTDQVLLIYVQPVKKNKVELLRVSSAKIRQETFKQNQMDTIILCKTQNKEKGISQKKLKPESQPLQIQKARIGASMNHRKSQKSSVQEMQKKLIDHIVDIKIKGLLDKFQQLQQRLISIQDQIANIYKKIQKSLQSINRQQIKNNVQKLFDKVTPQFESYFKEVFRQISGVLDQGLTYYTSKLAKQSQIHRDAFNQIINMTFDAAQQIVQLGRKQLNYSEKASEGIQKLLQIRKKWQNQTLQMAEGFKPPKNPVQVKEQISLNPTKYTPDKKSSPELPKKKN